MLLGIINLQNDIKIRTLSQWFTKLFHILQKKILFCPFGVSPSNTKETLRVPPPSLRLSLCLWWGIIFWNSRRVHRFIFVKIIWCSCWFCTPLPPPHLRQCISLCQLHRSVCHDRCKLTWTCERFSINDAGVEINTGPLARGQWISCRASKICFALARLASKILKPYFFVYMV